MPKVAGGKDKAENLALACVSCSLKKGAKQSATDPESGEVASLFQPRSKDWSGHFQWQGVCLVGRTPTGRATIKTLDLNRPLILAIRKEEVRLGRLP